MAEALFGKMPTTSVRRPVSRLTRSSGLVLLSFGRCAAGELVEGEQVFLGALKEFGDLRERVAEALKHVTESCCCRFEAWGVEDLARCCGDEAAL